MVRLVDLLNTVSTMFYLFTESKKKSVEYICFAVDQMHSKVCFHIRKVSCKTNHKCEQTRLILQITSVPGDRQSSKTHFNLRTTHPKKSEKRGFDFGLVGRELNRKIGKSLISF